ncbi:MAG: HAMP domain-containing sensor histidine kinase [Chloroflexota bacterium]
MRKAIELGLATLGEPSARPRDPEQAAPDESAPIDESSQTLRFVIHEISPIVGKLRHYASAEVPEYEDSLIRSQIDRLAALLESLTALGRVGGSELSGREFDLSSLIAHIANDESRDGMSIDLAGPQGVIAIGDPNQVSLVVTNGLRNALEASAGEGASRVLITWGTTDRDAWVTILDRGPGLSPSLTLIGTRPQSTKDGHQGVGLMVATRAARNLGGEIELASRSPSGTRFELRWPGVPQA